MKKPRILHIFSRYREYGGEEACFYAFNEALSPIAEVTPFVYSTQELSESKHSAPLKMLYMLSNRDVEKKLRKLIAETRFDAWIIHNTFPAMSPIVYQIAMEQEAPIIHYMHNYRAICQNGVLCRNGAPCFECLNRGTQRGMLHTCWRNNPIFSAIATAILRKTRKMGVWQNLSAYVAVSNKQRELLIKAGLPADKTRVIPHFISSAEPPTPVPPRKDVLYAGRLTKEKGVLHLIQAWHQLGIKDRKLYIMGDGPLRSELEQYIGDHHISSVCLTGFIPRDQQAPIWETCGLSIVPSLWEETFGMVVLEAWQHGAPVIVLPNGGLPELIDDGVNGWVTADSTLKALMDTLSTALNNDHRWIDMGAHGHSLLSAHYSVTAWLDSIEKLFKDLSIIP